MGTGQGDTTSHHVERANELALALMYLGLHDGRRTWKGFDWEVLDRLHETGLISNAEGRAKSVCLTAEGLATSEAMFRTYLEPAA